MKANGQAVLELRYQPRGRDDRPLMLDEVRTLEAVALLLQAAYTLVGNVEPFTDADLDVRREDLPAIVELHSLIEVCMAFTSKVLTGVENPATFYAYLSDLTLALRQRYPATP